MPDNILFYIVFLSQIILISYYYPRKILNRINFVLDTYTPENYPKLYVKPIEFYKRVRSIFKIVNYFLFVLGLVIIFGLGYLDTFHEGSIAQMVPFVYFMIQMIPLFLMEFFGFAYFKLMRKADLSTTRKAELLPRRLFDFISPKIFFLAIFMYFLCLLFFYNMDQFQFDFRNDTFIIFITLTLSNIFFAAIIYWNLYGKKLDPYQAGKDRIRQIEVTIKSLVYMSIGASLFLMLTKGINEYNLDYLEPALMSLYLQFVVLIGLGSMLRNIRIEKLDFDVYRNDVPVT